MQGTKVTPYPLTTGATAPPGRRMGDAGAIIGGSDDTAEAKFKALQVGGIHTVRSPHEIGAKMKEVVVK